MKKISLKKISPVWILTTLRGDEFDRFKAEVDNQFSIFSETELEGYEGAEKHKWWEVTQVDDRLSEKWEETISRGTVILKGVLLSRLTPEGLPQ